MNAIKRCTAVFIAVLMLVTTSVVANAAVIDEYEKKYLTDVIFADYWEKGIYNWYWGYTKSTVEIEHNPLASIFYMMIEAEVEVCDENSLQELSDGKMTLDEFYKKNQEFDFEKAKKMEKYKDSLLLGYEFGISDYQYGTWELELKDEDYTKIYGYFKEDAENFTLYEEDTNEVLGIYPRLIGYEYLDDVGNDGIGGSGGSGGSTGGGNGGGSNGKNDGTFVSSDSKNNDSSAIGTLTTTSTTVSSNGKGTESGAEKAETAKSGGDIERYDPDGNNPAVTPEIASAVDEMKSAAQIQSIDEDKPVSAEPVQVDKPNHTVRNVILIIAAIAVIAVAAVMVLNKKKGEKNVK